MHDIIPAPLSTPPVKVTWRRGGSVQITGGAIADIATGDRMDRLRVAVALANILQDGSVPEEVMELFDRIDVELPDEGETAECQAPAGVASALLDVEGR